MKRLSFAVCVLLVFVTFVAVSQTYEQIMAEIAEYPGPEEPLYEPSPDEAIWLTDLEGHADIYDNDSIRINYADWFDKSQVSRIEIKRNGIMMRFLPDMFDVDVLTNEQMKTFDGNPREYTPASSHTDHAILGYEYAFWFHGKSLKYEAATIKSPFHFTGDKLIGLGVGGDILLEITDQQIMAILQALKAVGFETVQFGNRYYVLDNTANETIAVYNLRSPVLRFGTPTFTDAEVNRLLRLINEAGMNAEYRIALWLSEEFRQNHPGEYGWDRSNLRPSDIDEWFENYTALCKQAGVLLEAGGADTFVVAVELNSLEKYTRHWEELANSVREVFSGKITLSEATHHFLSEDRNGEYPFGGSDFETSVGAFWDSYDLIHMNSWPFSTESFRFETQADQRLSVLTEQFAAFWQPAITHYGTTHPSLPLYFGEAGAFKLDGITYDSQVHEQLDRQEFTDFWVATLAASEYFGVDGIAAWAYQLGYWYRGIDDPYDHAFNRMPTLQAFAAVFGMDVEEAKSLLNACRQTW
jgi:hypothetical protein